MYRRVVRHERSIWTTTVAVVAMSAATIALLTLGSAMYGAFRYPKSGYVLAAASFALLVAFIVYVVRQRGTFESNRNRIFRELETRSEQLAMSNEALHEALQTQDVFLNTVSHELKTPLTCIMAYAEFLSDQELDTGEVRNHALAITEEGRSLMRLIDQMVDVTRFRSGPVTLDCERIDLNGVLSGVVDRGRDTAPVRGVAVDGEFEPRALPVRIDMDHLPAVLDDLVRTLCDRCDSGGRILVRSRRVDDEWAEVSITASGRSIGMRGGSGVFRPFAHLDPQPKGRSGDLGLTLPLLKRYVAAHGGSVQVTEAGGDRFELIASLPLAAPPHLAGKAA